MNVNLLYSDLSPELSEDWNHDVAKVVGSRAVKNSILGIITCRKGSRPFMPDFGCDIGDQLFEIMSPLIADTMKRNIVSAIRNYEPRVDELSVNVTPLYDDNAVVVTIQFSIIDDPDTLEQIKLKLSGNG